MSDETLEQKIAETKQKLEKACKEADRLLVGSFGNAEGIKCPMASIVEKEPYPLWSDAIMTQLQIPVSWLDGFIAGWDGNDNIDESSEYSADGWEFGRKLFDKYATKTLRVY